MQAENKTKRIHSFFVEAQPIFAARQSSASREQNKKNSFFFCRVLHLKSLGNKFEVLDDVDVLRALRLTLATLQAFTGLAMVLGH